MAGVGACAKAAVHEKLSTRCTARSANTAVASADGALRARRVARTRTTPRPAYSTLHAMPNTAPGGTPGALVCTAGATRPATNPRIRGAAPRAISVLVARSAAPVSGAMFMGRGSGVPRRYRAMFTDAPLKMLETQCTCVALAADVLQRKRYCACKAQAYQRRQVNVVVSYASHAIQPYLDASSL